MNPTSHYFTKQKFINQVLLLIAISMALTIFIIDIKNPLGMAIGAMYTIVILYSWLLPKVSHVYFFAIACTILVFVGLSFSDASQSKSHFYILNRLISVAVIWICTITVIIAKRGFEGLEESQREILDSNKKFEWAFDAAPNAMVMVNQGGEIMLINKQTELLFGYSRDELMGQSVDIFVPNSIKADHPKLFASFFKDPKVRSMGAGRDLTGRKKGGIEVPVEIGLNPIRNDDGVYVMASIVDISARKTLEVKNKRLLDVFDASTDYIAQITPDIKLIYANKAYSSLVDFESIEGNTIVDWHTDKQMELLDKTIFPEMLKKGIWRGELGLKNEKGIEIPCLFVGIVHKNSNGNVEYMTGIFREISEIKAVEQELMRSNKELDDFAFIASHDLKEPLRGIQQHIGFLEEDHSEIIDDDGKKRIKLINASCERLKHLVNDLLHFSRLGREHYEPENCNIKEMIDGIKFDLDVFIKDSNATIELKEVNEFIICEKVKLQEVFRNLIVNGIKYNDKKNKLLEIGSITKNDQTEYYVKDNGIGIDPEYHANIFKMFKRLHAVDEYGGGSGSGLALVKKIIESLNGYIRLESEEGRGSTFYFTVGNTQT